jgi:hypothetical protein
MLSTLLSTTEIRSRCSSRGPQPKIFRFGVWAPMIIQRSMSALNLGRRGARSFVVRYEAFADDGRRRPSPMPGCAVSDWCVAAQKYAGAVWGLAKRYRLIAHHRAQVESHGGGLRSDRSIIDGLWPNNTSTLLRQRQRAPMGHTLHSRGLTRNDRSARRNQKKSGMLHPVPLD